MEKKCLDCGKFYDSSLFKHSHIANHWYMECPEGHKNEVAKANDNDWEFFTPKRPKPV